MITQLETHKRAWAGPSTWTAVVRLNSSDNVKIQPTVRSARVKKSHKATEQRWQHQTLSGKLRPQ